MNELKKEFTKYEREHLYTCFLHYFGQYVQFFVILEELAELAKEISKHMRGYKNDKNIVEEIADVEIVLEELKLYLDIDDESVRSVKTYKLNRMLNTLRNIGENNNENN